MATNPRWWSAVALVVLFLSLPSASRADEPYARSRDYDLQNVRVHLWLDPEQRKVTGEVTHSLASLRDGLARLEFDSVGLTISSVTVAGKPAKFETTSTQLLVALDRPIRAGEKLDLTIRYEGRPRHQGFFFILPDKNYPNRKLHVWTQGEAEDTRYYIPIYDYPNNLTTSEMIATVPGNWLTVSNGKLVSVKDEPDGRKTWDWKQSQPHAVYLISLVAGEFDEVKDTWRNLPVAYYVLRGQGERIPPTFEHTKKMLEFFSERFGVPYPWDKYAQVAVEEHFGGMEHTSAATLTSNSMLLPELAAESLQRADPLVSHELAHQWFGDLVTCKDWANLWLNEGFATFAATLWEEFQYGADEAAYSSWRTRNRWMSSPRLYSIPILSRDFTDSIQNFGNTYDKAGLVLEMLRREMGDAEFFRGIRHYLEKHQHQNVVTADLISSIEEATGRNTDRFFEQWIYGAGAPKFEVRYVYDEAARQLSLEIKQTQKVEGRVGVFRAPVEIEITSPAGKKTFPITVSQASETFTFPLEAPPLLVLFDKGNNLLKSADFKKGWKEWIYQLKHAETVPDRADAAKALGEFRNQDEVTTALGEAALHDPFWGVRAEALRALGAIGGPAAQKQIEAARPSREPWVRQVAVELMGGFKDDPAVSAQLEKIYREDKAYRVRGAALASLAQQKAPNTLELLREAAASDSPDDRLRIAALRALGVLGNDKAVPLALEWAEPGKPFSVRSAAIAALGQLEKKNKEITKKLLTYAQEPYQPVAFSAVAAFGQRGDADSIASLEDLLNRGVLEGMLAEVARGTIARVKQAQAQQPSSQAAGKEAAGQAGLEKLEQLEREFVEIKERLKKLEEKAVAPK